MNKQFKNSLGGGRYETPELIVVELQLEGAVLNGSPWDTTGGGRFGDLNDGGDL